MMGTGDVARDGCFPHTYGIPGPSHYTKHAKPTYADTASDGLKWEVQLSCRCSLCCFSPGEHYWHLVARGGNALWSLQ